MAAPRPSLTFVFAVALASLLIGFGLGKVFDSNGAAEASGGAVALEAPHAAGAVASKPRAEVPMGLAEELGARSSAEASAPVVSSARVEAAKAHLEPAVAAEEGDGVIRVVVMDSMGASLPGVAVRCSLDERDYNGATAGADVGAGLPAESSLDEVLQRAAERWSSTRAHRSLAVTGDDGVCRVEGLVPGAYSVSVYKADWVISSEQRGSVRPGDTLYMQAKPVHTLALDVRLPDGTQPERAIVEFGTGEWSPEQVEWSPDAATVRFGTDAFALVVYGMPINIFAQERGVPSRFKSEELKVNMESPPAEPLRIELEARTGLRGHVTHLFAPSSFNDNIAIVRVENPASFDPQKPGAAGRTTYTVGGDFLFSDLEPGTYAVGLISGRRLDGQAFLQHQLVELTEGITEVTLVVAAPTLETSIAVECRSADGSPAQGVQFSCAIKTDSLSTTRNLRAVKGDGATYWIETKALCDFDFDAWPRGSDLELIAKTALDGSGGLQLESGRHEYVLQFVPTGSLTIFIDGYGQRSRDVEYAVEVRDAKNPDLTRPPVGRSRSSSSGDSGPEISTAGEITFDTIPIGIWTVSLLAGKQWFQREVVVSTDVEVTGGPATCRLSLAEVFDLTVSAPGLQVGDSLGLFRVDKQAQSFRLAGRQRLDGDLRVVFTGLLAGDYRVSGGGLGQSLDVVVPSPEVMFDPVLPNALMVTILDKTGLLAQAGFQSGDLVTSIGGLSLDEPGAMDALEDLDLTSAVAMTLERDGKQQVLYLGPLSKEELASAKMGGTLMPMTK